MKIILGILIVSLSTFLGYLISQKYTDRLKFYEDYIKFNDALISGITFTSKTVIDLIDKENKRYFNSELKEYFLGEKSIENGNFLQKSEKEYLKNYLSQIGNKNKQMQLEYVNIVKIDLNKEREKAKIELKKYKTLYVKLGFLIGIMIFILLI